MNFFALEYRFNYKFKNYLLLSNSLTHRSYNNKNNERLEFLGDSIINLIIGKLLYFKFINLSEGILSIIRSNIVNQFSLFILGKTNKIPNYIKLGESEKKNLGLFRISNISNTIESFIGAIYIDSNFIYIYKIIYYLYKKTLNNFNTEILSKDYKSILKEIFQNYNMLKPLYIIKIYKFPKKKSNFIVKCNINYLKINIISMQINRNSAIQKISKELLFNVIKIFFKKK